MQTSRRIVLLPFAAAIALAAACASPSVHVETRTQLEAAPLPPIDVRLLLQPEHERDAERYLRAAGAMLRTSAEWLGGPTGNSMTLIDTGWRDRGAVPRDAIQIDRTCWWTAPTSMAPELATARAISRRLWTDRLDTTQLPTGFVEGIAEYVARRAIVPLFESENQPPGYAFLERRYFGGFVPMFIRVRLLPETDGDPVDAYRAARGMNGATPQDDIRRLAGKTVVALATLERWLGRPILDQVLAEFIRTPRRAAPTIADFENLASAVSGQNLSWFFDEVFRSSRRFDYGVKSVTSTPQPDGGFTTQVVVQRVGDAQFTASSSPAIGSFESGRGLEVRTTFEDGLRRSDYWDGRAPEKTFTYRSPARAATAAVDPDRGLLMDFTQTNNSWTSKPQAAAASTRWAAHWLFWLQNALLTYAWLA
jgi:hypothetical protein